MAKGLAKGFGLLILLGLIVVGVVALARTGGDTAEVAGEAVEAEVAGTTEVAEDDDQSDDDADVETADAVVGEAEEEEPTETTVAPTTSTSTTTSTTTSSTTSSTTTSSTTTSTSTSTTTSSTTTSTTTTTAAPVTTTTAAPATTIAPTTTIAVPVATTTVPASERAGQVDDAAGAVEVADGDEAQEGVGTDIAIDGAFFGDPFPGPVTFFDGGFVRLDQGPDGFEVAMADDGVNWVTQPTEGLPQDAFLVDFEAADSGLIAVLEVFPFAFVDPFQVVFESGVLTEEQLNDFCDFEFNGPGEPIALLGCNFAEIDAAFAELDEALANAETEAERAAIEEEFIELEETLFNEELEELVRLEPGDEFYDEIVEAFIAEEEFFNTPADFVLATSQNGVFWTVSDLPAIPVVDDGFAFVNDAAVSGDRVALLFSIEQAFVDPFEILFEEGILSEDRLDEICDIRLDGPGEPIVITTCNFDEIDAAFAEFDEAIANAETDEERAALEEEFFELEEQLFAGEEILRLEPGDEFYDELAEGFFGNPDVTPLVLVGTIGGQFQSVQLPVAGFPNTIAATDEGFITTLFDFETGGTAVLRSTDGLTWTQVERFQGIADGTEFADVTIATNSDIALAIVVDFAGGDGNGAPVVLSLLHI